jgi:hypothetical protein
VRISGFGSGNDHLVCKSRKAGLNVDSQSRHQ